MCKDSVKDPGEAENRIENHDDVVWPLASKSRDIAEEAVARMGLQEGKVHEQVPYCFILVVVSRDPAE
jgi:hypothetical protein